MNAQNEVKQTVSIIVAPEGVDLETAERIRSRFYTNMAENGEAAPSCDLTLRLDAEGLSLLSEGQMLKGDFVRLLPRLKWNNLSKELLVRAARIKDHTHTLTAIDATAGLGEDSLLLAAAGPVPPT